MVISNVGTAPEYNKTIIQPLRLYAQRDKEKSVLSTISADKLVDVLEDENTEMSYSVTDSAPLPPGKQDLYHEYPYRETCRDDNCDRLIKVSLNNKKLGLALQLFYTLPGGKDMPGNISVGIKQINDKFPYPVRVGEAVIFSRVKLYISSVNTASSRVFNVKDQLITETQIMTIYDRLDGILQKAIKESREKEQKK